MRVLVAVPTYNEIENIRELHNRIRNSSAEWKILYVDDHSPDGTGALLDEIAEIDTDTIVLHRSARAGIGSAHKAAISYAYVNGYDVLITLDGDLTHQPEDIPKLLSGLDHAAVVVGSRFEGGIENWSLIRRLMTRTGHFLTQRILRMPYDSTSAFRVYDLRKIEQEVFDLVVADSYSFFFESLLVLHKSHLEIVEVPTILTARFTGDSKMQVRDVIQGIWRLVTSPFKYRRFGQ